MRGEHHKIADEAPSSQRIAPARIQHIDYEHLPEFRSRHYRNVTACTHYGVFNYFVERQ